MKKLTIIAILFYVSTSFAQTQEIIKYNALGIPEKVGEIRQGRNGQMDVYYLNKNNLMERTKTIVPTRSGVDIYNIDQNWLPRLENSLNNTIQEILNRNDRR